MGQQNLSASMTLVEHFHAEDLARQDRLQRNRISARKCRAKRKIAARDTEDRVNTLTAQNAALLQENERLQQLVQQLQAGAQPNSGDVVATNDTNAFNTTPRKRTKYESGVQNSCDFNESADGFFSSGYDDHHSVLDGCSDEDVVPFSATNTSSTEAGSSVASSAPSSSSSDATVHSEQCTQQQQQGDGFLPFDVLSDEIIVDLSSFLCD